VNWFIEYFNNSSEPYTVNVRGSDGLRLENQTVEWVDHDGIVLREYAAGSPKPTLVLPWRAVTILELHEE